MYVYIGYIYKFYQIKESYSTYGNTFDVYVTVLMAPTHFCFFSEGRIFCLHLLFLSSRKKNLIYCRTRYLFLFFSYYKICSSPSFDG